MVGPVTNTANPQVPAANTFKPGGSALEEALKNPEGSEKETRVEPASQSEGSKIAVKSSNESYGSSGSVSDTASRGGSLDITV